MARGQGGVAPDAADELRLIESTERGEDPLGLDESTGRGLDEAARALRKEPPKPVLPEVITGQVLSAIDGVVESEHALDVRFDEGLAFVQAHAHLTSKSPHSAEVTYRLAVPDGAVPTRVRVCLRERCTEAQPDADADQTYRRALAERDASAPLVWLRPIRDLRGTAFSLRIASVARDRELDVWIEYVCEASVHHGRARVVLPARGYDPRLAVAQLVVHNGYGGELEPASELEVDPTRAQELVAHVTPRGAVLSRTSRAACGRAACVRRVSLAKAAPLSTRPVWIALDVSPSMEGPARGRAEAVAAALLAALPETTPVRAFAFAARARELGAWNAGDVPLTVIGDALLEDLGAATRASALATLVGRDLERARPRLVVISDGQLDAAAHEQRALAEAHRRGAELWLVSVGDRAPHVPSGVSFAGVLRVPTWADRALSGDGLDALEDALAVIASPVVGPQLRAGEQRVVETRPAQIRSGAARPWLAHWLARGETQAAWVGGAAGEAPIAAVPFVDVAPPPAPPDTGMPAESVLLMLRTQLVPQARACLRSDRKGRGDYAVALTFRASFAQREVSNVDIEGAIPEPLRACLEGLMPRLRVPAFTGRIRVRYPIHTEREPPPPVIELEPDVAERVERVIRGK